MSEVKTEYEVSVSPEAVGDGMVRLQVLKMAPWFEITWNRQHLTHGISVAPSNILQVDVPVEGVSPDTPLTVDQLAELLTKTMEAVLPTCKVFIESVEDDFGIEKVEDF